MNRLTALLALGLLASRAAAQPIGLEIEASRDVFLPGEPVQVLVTIKNNSGRRLHFGDDPEWLKFRVTTGKNKPVDRLRPPAIEGEFDLDTGFSATRKVDLAPAFDLMALGFYTAAVTLRVGEFRVELTTPEPLKFELVRGFRLWEQDFGVPTAEGELPPAKAESRRYSVVQLRTTKGIRLYSRVSDAADVLPIKVMELGQYFTFTPPETQVDRTGFLHVLFQSHGRVFTYCVVSPDGDLLKRNSYDSNASRPGLKLDKEAGIVVAGGKRLLAINDIPPVDALSLPRELPPLPPEVLPVPAKDAKKPSAASKPKK
jgi:hypothetical protein